MTVGEKSLQELYDLNIELMDTLIVASRRFLDYCKEHDIAFEGLDGFGRLMCKASRICEEIDRPYHKNPVISEAQKDDERPPDKLPVYLQGGGTQ